jgi:hypothetical protein
LTSSGQQLKRGTKSFSSSGRHADDGQNSERAPNDAAQLRHLGAEDRA